MLRRSYSSYGHNFLNCYIGDKSKPEYRDKIMLLFRYHGNVEFSNFENSLRNISGYIADYEVVRGYVMFVYDIPDEFYVDYLRFIRGRYSMYSDELKRIIVGTNIGGTNDKIFNKHEELRNHWEEKLGTKLPKDAEVYSVPDMNDEVLNYETHFEVEQ